MAFVVCSRIGEIQQVAAWIVAAFVPDAGFSLYWSVRCGIHGRPGLAAVVCVRDVSIPRAFEIRCLVIATRARAEESNGSALGIAGYCRGEYCILHSHADAYIHGRVPCSTAVAAHCYVNMVILLFRGRDGTGLFSNVREIDRVRRAAWLRRIFADPD